MKTLDAMFNDLYDVEIPLEALNVLGIPHVRLNRPTIIGRDEDGDPEYEKINLQERIFSCLTVNQMFVLYTRGFNVTVINGLEDIRSIYETIEAHLRACKVFLNDVNNSSEDLPVNELIALDDFATEIHKMNGADIVNSKADSNVFNSFKQFDVFNSTSLAYMDTETMSDRKPIIDRHLDKVNDIDDINTETSTESLTLENILQKY